MKVISVTTLALMIFATHALASAGGANVESIGPLSIFFIALGVLIILFQFLPGVVLFLGILKGIFSSKVGKSGAEAVENNRASH